MITATFHHDGKTWTAEGERKEVQNRRCGLAPRYTITVKSVTKSERIQVHPGRRHRVVEGGCVSVD